MRREHGLLEKIIQWGKSPLVVETVQKSITIGGNTGAAGTADLSKSGYTPVAIVGFQISGNLSGHSDIRQWRLNGSQAYAYVWNNHSASQTWTLTFHVLWLKTLGGGYCIAVFSMLSAIFSLVRRWRHDQIIWDAEHTCHKIKENRLWAICHNASKQTDISRFFNKFQFHISDCSKCCCWIRVNINRLGDGVNLSCGNEHNSNRIHVASVQRRHSKQITGGELGRDRIVAAISERGWAA